jgi:hypothetical protein
MSTLVKLTLGINVRNSLNFAISEDTSLTHRQKGTGISWFWPATVTHAVQLTSSAVLPSTAIHPPPTYRPQLQLSTQGSTLTIESRKMGKEVLIKVLPELSFRRARICQAKLT